MIRVYNNKESFLTQHRRRSLADHPGALASVREILEAVRERGDAAVLAYTERYDGAMLTALAVTDAELAAAEDLVEREVADALQEAADNIRSFHARQVRNSWLEYGEDGSVRGLRIIPLDAVGAYVPGGSAAYPSSVLMTVIPARVAGVKKVVLATPPQPDGSVNPYTLLAAKIAGADAVYKCGGAQAVAALAYGTESIPAVDKIVGPGNLYVTLAKREVAGLVGIDMTAGPSEVLVVADETARADFVACDLLSQAEHDPLAAACCITTSAALTAALPDELERQCAGLARREIAAQSLAANGAVVKVESLDEAVEVANLLAPEHLELQVTDPWALLAGIRHAGAVFLGAYTPEPVGDYWAGPNHVLPTAGAGRYASVLAVDDFVKRSSVLYYPPAVLLRHAVKIEALAAAEGLTAHSRAVAVRREELERQNR
ncbi:MAG TPA: histidinol dehydrogenase [Firmicutes bacterium]|nr:histidinol dehydrogenase [Bacillota bacterium]